MYISTFCPTPVIALMVANSCAAASSNALCAKSITLIDAIDLIFTALMPIDREVDVMSEIFMSLILSVGDFHRNFELRHLTL